MLLPAVLLLVAGCGKAAEPSAKVVTLEEASIREAVIVADPQAAVDEIYQLEKGHSKVELDGEQLAEVLGIDAGDVDEYYAYYTDPRSGLSDVVLLKPSGTADREALRRQLYQYRDRRADEFENYDIFNSYDIAQSGVVYDQGDYLILLMLKDNEAAQDIIDLYIPQ